MLLQRRGRFPAAHGAQQVEQDRVHRSASGKRERLLAGVCDEHAIVTLLEYRRDDFHDREVVVAAPSVRNIMIGHSSTGYGDPSSFVWWTVA